MTNEETKAASGEQERTGRVIIGLPRVFGGVAVGKEEDCHTPQESAVKPCTQARAHACVHVCVMKSKETGWGVNFTIL